MKYINIGVDEHYIDVGSANNTLNIYQFLNKKKIGSISDMYIKDKVI